ncbi:Vacuolar protein sorting-associated protein [Plasmodiophora brassicae]|uniref:Vacuolar protein sorting-associated protein 28 homolog n=1 Tax=Plasmodiophora brassicae TaxID=37360 RepID=A0A0G4ILP2_PLABS|nr:hypothetical protein PBRA_004773 [Plasmodiophora brassicae]SPQ93371.1 unnamed protein product [Plasmodiophora brassicae]
MASAGDDGAEVKLATTREERFRIEKLADLYAILLTTEHLETAYVRDAVTAGDYAPACAKLIAQFKTVKDAVAEFEPDTEKFMARYSMQCPAAYKRLIEVGVPATIQHGDNDRPQGSHELYVAEAVQHFITTMDSLKLEMHAVDEVYPHLKDLMDSLNKISIVLPDHIAKVKVMSWLTTLNQMRASDELSSDQARQCIFDLEQSYQAFVSLLNNKS